MKSNDIITTRAKLDKDIKRYWKIIKSENVIYKGEKRNFDLPNVLSSIIKMSEERVKIKLYLQCINLGITKFSELPKDNNYESIFTLSEKKEQLVQLDDIKTINPKVKRLKGKKALNVTEIFTSAYITKLKDKLQLEIIELEEKISKFNENIDFEVDKPLIALVA